MKKAKLSYLLLISLVVMVTALTCVSLVACNPDPIPQSGNEAGAYYYDAGGDEYSLVLGGETRFTLTVSGTTKLGIYTLSENVLTLFPNNENQIAAVFGGDVITLNYEDAEYRFLKKVNYTVSFDSKGGSNVNSATVVNGKKVSKPADPSKDGFIFVGWYTDGEQYTTPFSFNSQIITADMTVYARWVEKQVGQTEFVVDFDADNGESNPPAQMTVGGKLFNLPEVEREGYEFKGWWYSMNGDGSLTYEFKDGMSVNEDATLYALWQSTSLGSKLADPIVNVDSKSISWNSLGTGVREYRLQVKNPDGNYIVDKSMGGTVESIAFDEYPAGDYGDYVVTVTAVATSGDANNSVATRVFKNKGLARVSQFTVIEPSTLLFNAVENAERYLITVDCGDKNHNHVGFSNDNSTNFNFADCVMQNDGIKFTVTAVADGYASSVSKQFVYAPKLDAVSEFAMDEQTQKLVWNKVDKATGYMVSVKCGNDAHDEQFVNVGAVNSISLKECAACEGGIVVKVYPVSKSYISPEPATYTFDKKNLATPANIRINGTTVSWDAVDGAKSYTVSIADKAITTDTNSVDLAGKVDLVEKQTYSITVIAKGESIADSLASDALDARNLAMADSLKYVNGKLSWTAVIGAMFYDVQVNDEPVFSVTEGKNYTAIELTKAGENVIKVRFADNTGAAFEWVSTTVFAHTLTFVSDGGSSVDEQYKAFGDEIEFPTPQKAGYDFLAWYNTPNGPESNGAAFRGNVFNAPGDIMLYACYTPKSYKLTYHYGDGGNGAETESSVLYHKDFQLSVPQANEATSAFGGWFSAPNGNGVQYTDDKGNSLAAWNKMEDTDVYAFWYDDVLSFTLTSIGGREIYSVMQGSRISQVTEVTIPAEYKGVKVGMLSGNAFNGCSNLTAINIPNTVEVISNVDPFAGCSSLQAINVYEVEGNGSIRYWSADGVLFDNGRLDQQPTDPSQIRATISFMPLAKTGSYTIPEGIAEIPSKAFANSVLSRVVIPSSVAVIGVEAFVGCENLTTIVFDTGSTIDLTIADAAFKNCKALETITLPARLANIALTKYELLSAVGSPAAQEVSTDAGVTNAFVGCKNLNSIYIADGNKYFEAENGVIYSANQATLLYAHSSVKGNAEGDFIIPDGVQAIADGAFMGCNSISGIVIPSTVRTVGECAFYNTDIERITFKGNGIGEVTIGKYAFRDCDDLQSVTFEEGNRVTTIGEGAFMGCDDYKFTEIVLPQALKSVGAQAFRDCDSLEIVTINSIQELEFGNDAFYGCSSIETLTLPKTVKTLPGVFGGCTSLEEVIVDPESPYFESVDGVLYNKGQTTILFYPQGKSDSELVLPDTLITISDGVFAGNRTLSKVTIGKNVEYIGKNAFRESRISEFEFAAGDNGATVLEIGAYAFYGNEYLEAFELPARTTKVGEYAFAYDSAYDAAMESFVINEGLSEIPDYMFYNSRYITEITIPASVQTIGKYAFANCGSSYGASFAVTFAEGSKLVSIGDNAFYSAGSNSSVDVDLVLPEGLQTIGYQAFMGSSFTSVNIPKTVKAIGAEAFAGSSSWSAGKIKSVTFEAGGTDDLILGVFRERKLDYNDNEVLVEGGVFKYCKNLTSIVLPERVTFIGASTFENSGLTSVTFGENTRLKHIGNSAFESTLLESITIPKSVSNGDVVVDDKGTVENRIGIGKEAFYGVDTIEVVNFEAGGTEPLSIGDAAFYSMDMLTTVNLPSRIADFVNSDGTTMRGISERAFASFYTGGISSGQNTGSSLSAINIAEGGAQYCSFDGVVYTSDMKTLVVCPAGKTGSFTIDARVTMIEHNAFCSSALEEVIFAGTIDSEDMVISERAFYNCSLTEVVLSDNVVEAGDDSFGNCKKLVSITLSAKIEKYNPNMLKNTNIQTLKVSAGNGTYSTKDGVLFSKDMKTLIIYPATIEAETYTVPDGVTEIGAQAFIGNKFIKTVVLPSGLKKIGESAFSQCSNLTNVTIPNTVESIGKQAFYLCRALTKFEFEKGGTENLVLENEAFSNTGITSVTLPARLMTIGNSTFYRCTNLETVVFENGIKLDSIGNMAFYGDSALKAIALPAGMNKMGNNVFTNCSAMKTATFGEGIVEIGERTFAGCVSLESVSFPASLQKMGVNTFNPSDRAYCSSLTSVTFAQGSQLSVLPEGTFNNCTALERFTVPANVTLIENRLYGDGFETGHNGVFQDCTALRIVTFEEGSKCKEIGDSAFMGCAALEAFSIPSSVARLGRSAFENCSSIVEIVIPTTATVYGEGVFERCTSLERVTLNDKVTELSNYMFAYCSSLKSINIPASVTKFGNGLFTGTGFEEFVIPANIKNIPDSFLSSCKSLVSVTFPAGLQSIGRSAFESCSALTEIDIPDSVEFIDESAFEECRMLKTIKLSANLEEIGNSAFQDCSSIISITIPSKVKVLGEYSFYGCTKLIEVFNNSSLDLEDDDNYYSYLAYYAEVILKEGDESVVKTTADGFTYFESDGAVRLIEYSGSATNIVLPSNITELADYVFSGSNIVSVEIPAGVTKISDYAFANCANLTTVTMKGQVTVIGQYAFSGCAQLTDIDMPDSVLEIKTYAFESCSSLEEITLSANLTTLGRSVFRDCSKLKSIELPNGITRLESALFRGCVKLESVKLPNSMTRYDDYDTFSGCTSLSSFSMDDGGSSTYKVVDGVLYSADGSTLQLVPMGMTGTFVISKDVTSFSSRAFEGSNLDMLIIESGRENKLSIVGSTYYSGLNVNSSKIKAIVISVETVGSIGWGSFSNWTSEQTIYFVESKEAIDTAYDYYAPSSDNTSANIVYDYEIPAEETPEA